MKHTFTEGSIVKSLIKFAIPLICASALQQLYVWVDALMVGNLLGEAYLAGVGAIASIDLVMVSTISGFVIGGTIVVARLSGEKKESEFRTITSSFFLFMVCTFAVIGGIGCAVTRPLLVLLNTPEAILEISIQYLRIIFLGVPFVAGYNVLAGVLRGVGDSKIGMYALVVAILINLGLNPLFILVFNWGITGVAVATVISQAVSLLLVIIYTEKKFKYLAVRLKACYLKWKPLVMVVKKGVPLAMQMSLVAVGSVVLQSVMNSFGYEVVTGITTAYKVDYMILLIVVNTADSISVFVSQNIGAGNPKRALRGTFVGTGIVVAASLFTTLIVVLFGASFLRMFGLSETIVDIGATFFILNGSFYALYGLYESGIAYLQGEGRVVMASVIALLTMVFRIVMSYALCDIVGWKIISYAEVSCWAFGVILVVVLGAITMKKHKNLFCKTVENKRI
ncbi:MAG: MATE family efflux transporter [Bacillota bacterium]